MRTIVAVLMLLALAAPAALADAREFTVFGTLQPQPADAATGYYPPRLVLEAGDSVLFTTLTPADGEHPALMLRDGEYYPADCHPADPDEPCFPFYGRETRYSALPEGAYTFECTLHDSMKGELLVVADLT